MVVVLWQTVFVVVFVVDERILVVVGMVVPACEERE
jgi:hypothetical protein